MPFEGRFPRALTVTAVQQYAPGVAGVYGLSTAREWIYIGETANIRDTLLGLIREPVTSSKLVGFVFEECEGQKRQLRLDRLLAEYSPRENLLPQRHLPLSGVRK